MLNISYHTIPSIQPIIHLAWTVKAAAFKECNSVVFIVQTRTSYVNVTDNPTADYLRLMRDVFLSRTFKAD